MRSFTDLDALIGMVPSQVVTRLSAIDFGRGSEAFYRDQMPGLLTELADRARVLSITASSAIEGVIVADADRAQRIIDRRTTTLRNRSEQELAGYRDPPNKCTAPAISGSPSRRFPSSVGVWLNDCAPTERYPVAARCI